MIDAYSLTIVIVRRLTLGLTSPTHGLTSPTEGLTLESDASAQVDPTDARSLQELAVYRERTERRVVIDLKLAVEHPILCKLPPRSSTVIYSKDPCRWASDVIPLVEVDLVNKQIY